MALTIAHRLQECNAAHRGDTPNGKVGLTGWRRGRLGVSPAAGMVRPREQAAVDDLGQRTGGR